MKQFMLKQFLLNGKAFNAYDQKSNLHYTRGITPKRVTSGRAHLRGVAPEQHSSEETSQRRRAVVDTVSDLAGPGIEPQTYGTDSNVRNNSANGSV